MSGDENRIEIVTHQRLITSITIELSTTYWAINKRHNERRRRQQNSATPPGSSLAEASSGHYVPLLGEEIGERYIVRRRLGSGSFGVVVCAFDVLRCEHVAVKVICSRDLFLAQGAMEVETLSQLQECEGIVTLKNFFMWRGHLCLVFELLSVNLYDLIKATRWRGLSLGLVRKVLLQLCTTLSSIQRQLPVPVIYCDLKPENICLQHPKRSGIKLIDFGSSCRADERIHTYIQSRFYRAPEVVLGLPYSTAIDIWSLGVVAYELLCGTPLFTGSTEEALLFKITERLGDVPTDLIDRGAKRHRFYARAPLANTDSPTGPYFLRRRGERLDSKPRTEVARQLCAELGDRFKDALDAADVEKFADFVAWTLTYDPSLRPTCDDLLHHPLLCSTPDS